VNLSPGAIIGMVTAELTAWKYAGVVRLEISADMPAGCGPGQPDAAGRGYAARDRPARRRRSRARCSGLRPPHIPCLIECLSA
jgi:hypothetical protein